MQIAIITSGRPNGISYVEDTVRQIVGDPTSPVARGLTFLDVFSDDIDQQIATERMPTLPVWWMRRDLHPTLRDLRATMTTGAQRALVNFLNALMSGWGELVLFEDDATVKPDWYSKLRAVVADSNADFVSMYWTNEVHFERDGDGGVEKHRIDDGIAWRGYRHPNTFYGTVGIYLGALARIRLTRFVQEAVIAHEHGVRELRPYDLLVQSWLNTVEYGSLPIAVGTFPALVDHRGDVSAIVENQPHGPRRSPGF